MKIIHFADLHLGVETYGHINPESGLSSRLEDFLGALDRLVGYALDNKADLVLFCGDAYKTREPSQTQQREFARRIRRLSESNIPFFLLTGNHDMPNAAGRATTMEIFHTLAVPNVTVASKPGIFKIETASGDIQICALPWVRRSLLLGNEETKNLTFNEINERLERILTDVILDFTSKIDPSLPSILAAHVWVMNASTGTEKNMTIGQEHMLLPGNVANPAFDYVALGHIHKEQVLSENPPTIYSGSLERLDFGDEELDKGFYVVDIDTEGEERKVSYKFHSINARRFFTLRIAVDENDFDPTSTIVNRIEDNLEKIKDAVTRIDIKLPASAAGKIRDGEIYSRTKGAYYLTVNKDIQRETRLKSSEGAIEGITPSEALKAYLKERFTEERSRVLQQYGERLINEETGKG
jgi:DNA repair protein SbcD/Mre11